MGQKEPRFAFLPPSPLLVPSLNVPNLFSHLDEPAAEEGNSGKAQILVGHEHAHGDEVGLTEVVYEAADVAIEAGIDAVHLAILGKP